MNNGSNVHAVFFLADGQVEGSTNIETPFVSIDISKASPVMVVGDLAGETITGWSNVRVWGP